MIDQLTLSPGALGNLLRKPQATDLDGGDTSMIDPLDGRRVRSDSVDELVDSLEQADRAERALQDWRTELKSALAALRNGNQKTQRLQGLRRRVKIVDPPEKLDNSILREAWNSFPRIRDEFLRIERLAVKTREFKKAVGTSGPADFNSCISMIRSAIKKPAALPTVVIEE